MDAASAYSVAAPRLDGPLPARPTSKCPPFPHIRISPSVIDVFSTFMFLGAVLPLFSPIRFPRTSNLAITYS